MGMWISAGRLALAVLEGTEEGKLYQRTTKRQDNGWITSTVDGKGVRVGYTIEEDGLKLLEMGHKGMVTVIR